MASNRLGYIGSSTVFIINSHTFKNEYIFCGFLLSKIGTKLIAVSRENLTEWIFTIKMIGVKNWIFIFYIHGW